MECKMSFFKYRVMKRLFLFAVCAWAGLSLWASSVKGQGTACETRSEKVPAKVYMTLIPQHYNLTLFISS